MTLEELKLEAKRLKIKGYGLINDKEHLLKKINDAKKLAGEEVIEDSGPSLLEEEVEMPNLNDVFVTIYNFIPKKDKEYNDLPAQPNMSGVQFKLSEEIIVDGHKWCMLDKLDMDSTCHFSYQYKCQVGKNVQLYCLYLMDPIKKVGTEMIELGIK